VIARLQRAVRVEDVLLAGWLLIVEPLLLPPVDEGAIFTPNPVEGILGLGALVGLAVCVGVRTAPGVPTGLSTDVLPLVVGPLLGALSFVVADVMNDLGAVGAGPVLVVVLGVLAIGARFTLPPLDVVRRRALVTPFILLAGGAFGQFLSGFSDLFDIGALVRDAQASGLDPVFTVFVAALVLLGVLVFYLLLVFAPRQIAEREGSPGAWATRFALFVLSLAAGATIGGLSGR
jgi:hypothetical protein